MKGGGANRAPALFLPTDRRKNLNDLSAWEHPADRHNQREVAATLHLNLDPGTDGRIFCEASMKRKQTEEMNGANQDIPPVPKWLEPALQEYILLVDKDEAETAEFGLGFI
jgi:hypothetical protein